jgi:hypothetical protein
MKLPASELESLGICQQVEHDLQALESLKAPIFDTPVRQLD